MQNVGVGNAVTHTRRTLLPADVLRLVWRTGNETKSANDFPRQLRRQSALLQRNRVADAL